MVSAVFVRVAAPRSAFQAIKWSQCVINRGGVEDTRLEAKVKDTKKIRVQGQPFRGQTLSRPRTGMFEAKAKDTSTSALQKKKVFTKIF